MVTWKKISCTLTKLGHVTFGIMTVLAASYVQPIISLIMFLTFVIYELDEEWHLEDQSYEDIKEYGIGLGIGVTAILIIKPFF